MIKKEPNKRQLKYGNLDSMLTDVDQLVKSGYQSQGKWTLGQACGHVADWMSFPLVGFPKPPLFMRAIFGVMKVTGYSRRMSKKIMAEGFKGGMPTDPETVPDPSFTDQEGVNRLHDVVQQMKEYKGELHPSPLFGPLDMASHIRVSLLHAEHHFGYLFSKHHQNQ